MCLCRLFVEKARLGCSGCRGLAAGDADDAEDGQFGNGRAGDVDAVGVGVEIGRGQMEAVVEEGEEVVGDNAFKDGVVPEADFDPEAFEFGAAEEGFAFRGEALLEIADEVDPADLGEGNLLMLAVLGKEIEKFGATQTAGVEIAAKSRFVGEFNDDFFVRRGWGSRFHQITLKGAGNNCRRLQLYVMLSAVFLSTYCFYWS